MAAYDITLPIAISFWALIVSLLTHLFTRQAWHENNRPIVTAQIVTNSAGSEAIAYDLVVQNVGARPAVDIRLTCRESHLQRILKAGASGPLKNEVIRCFSENAEIPLLHAGKSVKNGFGATGDTSGILLPGASLPIEIHYRDLERRGFKSRLKLLVLDTAYFAGSGWTEAPESPTRHDAAPDATTSAASPTRG